MKHIVTAAAIVCVLLCSGCDTTDIRNRGTISIAGHSGNIYELVLEVPAELEDKVHKAHWECSPPDNAVIRYEENTLFGEASAAFKNDRTARLTLLDPAGVTVEVFAFHRGQTSPQRFASRVISP
ncbi:MAG: hypothetical protein JW904_10610 [Spirochaetales bacterium]|nr:hypothetical protein [Spirochaetales bacterium]